MKAYFKRVKENGSLILIALLLIAFSLTVAISVALRATSNVKLTTRQEESEIAFGAAQGGIEKALQILSSGSNSVSFTNEQIGNAKADANSQFIGNGTSFDIGKARVGDAVTVWFVEHDGNGDPILGTSNYARRDNPMVVCWSDGTPRPAVELILYYKDSTDDKYKLARAAYDPDSARSQPNFFTSPNGQDFSASASKCIDTTRTIAHKLKISDFFSVLPGASSEFVAMRVRPYYSETSLKVTVDTGDSLPTQGNKITSIGKTDTGITRKIEVIQLYPAPPSELDNVLFSGSGLSK